MRLIITEKPSVARDIAKVLKITTKKGGYFESNDTQISWAFGHLIRLSDPDKYHESLSKWNRAALPIIPEHFQKEITPDSGGAEQFNTMKILLNNPALTEVICATDAGREGELIFRYIYEMAGATAPIKRLWISSQTDAAIKKGFESLKPGESYIPLFHSAQCRSEADWLVGMNATRAYTIQFSRGNGVMSVGRVQTPVLKMIIDRYREFLNFVPETFYEIHLTVHHPLGNFAAKWVRDTKDRIQDEKEAQAIFKHVQDHPNGNIQTIIQKEKKEQHPLLYDLTEIQKEANRKFKFSADKTLKTMQALYEQHKVLTYPRTSSRYLSTDIQPQLLQLVKNAAQLGPYAAFAQDILDKNFQIASKMIDDKKVTDHHAIIPTDKTANLSQLSGDERKLFDLVMKRFLAAFYPLCVKDHTEIITKFGTETFRSTGTIITQAGWRQVYGNEDDTDSDDPKAKQKDGEVLLPNVKKGDDVTHKKAKLQSGKTKAPQLHTEASLLANMETAGKQIDDDTLRQAMKECGLGTPATRAAILERLLSVKYAKREKNKFIPTEKGIFLIDNIKNEALLSPELTGLWEKKLNEIAQGHYQRETYMNEIKEFTQDVIESVFSDKSDYTKSSIGTCPKCNSGNVVNNPKSFSCSNWKDQQCDFVIWKQMAGKEISEEIAITLLEHGKTDVIEGFKNKEGKPFNACLTLTEYKVSFNFDMPPLAECPVCGKGIVETAKAYSCSGWRETGCKVAIWKEMAQRKITKEEALQLIQDKQIGPLEGFVSRAGSTFSAALKLEGDKVSFVFE